MIEHKVTFVLKVLFGIYMIGFGGLVLLAASAFCGPVQWRKDEKNNVAI